MLERYLQMLNGYLWIVSFRIHLLYFVTAIMVNIVFCLANDHKIFLSIPFLVASFQSRVYPVQKLLITIYTVYVHCTMISLYKNINQSLTHTGQVGIHTLIKKCLLLGCVHLVRVSIYLLEGIILT